MPVDIADILHVLAHELRAPVGIAQGYIRMLLEDRLTDPVDRRRALEQTQKALARVSDLTKESSAVANWFQTQPGVDEQPRDLDAAVLIARVQDVTGVDNLVMQVDVPETAGVVRTFDADALVGALATMVHATSRELRGQPCTLSVRLVGDALEVLVGPESRIPDLARGPEAPEADTIRLERGGLGLALVQAALALDAHGAQRWTLKGARDTVGIRIRLDGQPQSRPPRLERAQ